MKISTLFKRKIILIFLLAVALVGGFFVKADLKSNVSGGFISAFYAELNLKIKTLIKFAGERFSVLGQEAPLFFFPHFPQRLLYVTSEISAVSEELVALNDELLNYINQCHCQNAQSQCRQITEDGKPIKCEEGLVGVFGEVCPSIKTTVPITPDDTGVPNINYLTLRLSFLQNLLKEEMDAGLEKQLATLRKEDAQTLQSNLEKLLEVSPEIQEAAINNMNLPGQCSVEKCTPNCGEGKRLDNICIHTGEQKPNEIKFEVGVDFLDDFDPGQIGIKNINLNLPEEIDVPGLPDLPGLTISISDITLTCPTEPRTITFHAPIPSLPEAPTLTLSCPKYPSYSSYQCSAPSDGAAKTFVEAEWYYQTFSFLSEKCLKVALKDFDIRRLRAEPGQKEYETLIKSCMSPKTVSPTLVEQCDTKGWVLRWIVGRRLRSEPEFEICGDIGYPIPNLGVPWREDKAIEWCNKLFETPQLACSSDPTETTKQKCKEIKQKGEKIPEPCKFLPLFTAQFPAPKEDVISGAEQSCPAQKIGDYPDIPMDGCSLSFPSMPKISFPQIIIPDIRLPTFSFPPFFSVDLPSFIFEDLIIPDIELCDLSDCQFQFPYLSFKTPSLKIPEVKVPPVQVDIPGYPNVPPIEVSVAPINFPDLSFNLPQLINLSSLLTPELEIPQLSLPQPQLRMSFSGIDIDLLNLLLGLIGIPSTVCVGTEAPRFIDISYPDYIFGWPAFPRIPEIPFCKDIRTHCGKIKGGIQDIANKSIDIQNIVNSKFQEEIQQKLDKLANDLNQKITDEVQRQLNDIVETKIKPAITNHLAKYAPGYAVPIPPEAIPIPSPWMTERKLPCDKIPPLTIPIGNIDISPKKLSDYPGLPDLPDKIPIDWPDDLKKIQLNLIYDIPDIPLEKLSYSKDVNIRLPGFQLSSNPDIQLLQNTTPTECKSQPPSGGNPCQAQISKIRSNLTKLKELAETSNQASQKIKDVLY